MRFGVKICGIASREAAEAAAAAGADAVGFVFAESPRCIDPRRAAALAAGLPPSLVRVAVFHLPRVDEVKRVLDAFDAQLVQAEPAGGLARALAGRCGFWAVLHEGPRLLEHARSLGAGQGAPEAVLLEAAGRGGRGLAPDWARAAELAREMAVVLAGGLRADNVGQAIRRVRPRAVDVSSGVECAPGIKSPRRISEFVAAVRRVEAELAGEEEARR